MKWIEIAKRSLGIQELVFGCAMSAMAVFCAPGIAQSVEIVDWIGVGGISMDSTPQFDVVRSAALPFSDQVSKSYFPTSLTPGGNINAFFDLITLSGVMDFECNWSGSVDTASGDGSTDGPLTAIAVLIRVNQSVSFSLESSASIGVGAGQPSNVPLVSALIIPGFCFAPGTNPQAGQVFCNPNGLTPNVSLFHSDEDGFFTSLWECCEVTPDVGLDFGVLEPGEYSISMRSWAEMNVLFGGGGDANGRMRILLEWDEVCLPDLNFDGFLDSADITAFVGLFLSQDPAGDLNFDGFLDSGDIILFVNAFLAGC